MTSSHNQSDMEITRRKFLTSSLTAGAALASFPAAFADVPAAVGYELQVFATNWGFPGSWDTFAQRIKDAGYDGAEIWVPGEQKERAVLNEAMAARGLKLGLLVGGSSSDPRVHLQEFQAALQAAVAMQPVYINCHSGKDFFSIDNNKPFMLHTQAVAAQTGIPVYHETHRGRILYSAPVSRQYLELFPHVRITLDISHWCNVHESLLGDQRETVALALSRTDHIHARIGHAEGPQVSDPRAPEWTSAVEAHVAWWDEVARRKRQEGKTLTMLTEFGPIDYLPALPFTRQPVADQWAINVYMLELLRKRYS